MPGGEPRPPPEDEWPELPSAASELPDRPRSSAPLSSPPPTSSPETAPMAAAPPLVVRATSDGPSPSDGSAEPGSARTEPVTAPAPSSHDWAVRRPPPPRDVEPPPRRPPAVPAEKAADDEPVRAIGGETESAAPSRARAAARSRPPGEHGSDRSATRTSTCRTGAGIAIAGRPTPPRRDPGDRDQGVDRAHRRPRPAGAASRGATTSPPSGWPPPDPRRLPRTGGRPEGPVSNHLAVAGVTATLVQLLDEAVNDDLDGAHVTAGRPDDDADAPCVRVFLYRIEPNGSWRNNDLPTRGNAGGLVERPQAAIVLNYLLTFIGNDASYEPQQMLGSVVRTLHAHPLLSRPEIDSMVATALNANSPLSGVDLAEQPEVVRLTPLTLSLDELSNLWSSFFDTAYRLSIAYQASVVLLTPDETPMRALPVRTAPASCRHDPSAPDHTGRGRWRGNGPADPVRRCPPHRGHAAPRRREDRCPLR